MELLKKEYKNILLILALFLLNIVLFKFKMYNLHTDFGREAYFSALVSRGGIVYKDLFDTFIGPLSYMFNGFLLFIFGTKLSVLFFLGALNAFSILIFSYLISRRFLSSSLSLAITVFIMYYCCFYCGLMNYIVPYSYAIVYGLNAVLLSLFCYFKFLDENKTQYLYLSFVLAFVAMSCKYEYFLYLICLFIVYSIKKTNLKEFLYVCVLTFVVPSLLFAVLFLQGLSITDLKQYLLILSNFLHQPYLKKVYATSFYFDIRYLFTSILNFVYMSLIVGFCYLFSNKTGKFATIKCVLSALFVGILAVLSLFNISFINFLSYESLSYIAVLIFIIFCFNIKNIIKNNALFLLVASALVVSIKVFWYVSGNFYGRYFMPLLIIALCSIVISGVRQQQIKKRLESTFIFILCLLSFVAFRLNTAALVMNNTAIITAKGVICEQKNKAVIYNKLIDYININTKKQDKIVVLGMSPLLNFLSDRESAGFYNHFDEAIQGAYTDVRIIDYYKKHSPAYFVIYLSKDNKENYCNNYGKNLCLYVKSDYENAKTINAPDSLGYYMIFKNKNTNSD